MSVLVRLSRKSKQGDSTGEEDCQNGECGAFRLMARSESSFDKFFLPQEVPLSNLVSPQKWQRYL